MKLYLPLLALTALTISSCSTAYKTGQTPDDVYYSPASPQDEYVVVEKTDDRSYRGEDYYEDRYLRNRINNRYRYSALDDYYNNPYAYNSYGYYNSWNSPWNSYYTWNSYYNPYYSGYGGYGGGIIIKNPGRYVPPSRAVAFNPASYGVSNNRSGVRSYHPGINPNNTTNSTPRYNNSNNGRSNNNNTLGSSIRRVFTNNGSSSNNNGSRPGNDNSTPTRSYNPPSSSSSSSGGSSRSSGSSGGGGGSRPIR